MVYQPPLLQNLQQDDERALRDQVPIPIQAGRVKENVAGSGLPESLGVFGSLEVRLASQKREIKAAQRLRYKVFYEEGFALADPVSRLTRRDLCGFDAICDHLIVIDHAAKRRHKNTLLLPQKPKVVGTYRLLRAGIAKRHHGFYSENEFCLGSWFAGLAKQGGLSNVLELGRSCVLPAYRNRRTLDLLWQGIGAYAATYHCSHLFGTASFSGLDVARHRLALSYLYHEARSEIDILAKPRWQADFAPLARDKIDPRAAMSAMPPLIKGYLRLGAKFGAGVAQDRTFGTLDVFVDVPFQKIAPRYFNRFVKGA